MSSFSKSSAEVIESYLKISKIYPFSLSHRKEGQHLIRLLIFYKLLVIVSYQ